VFRPTDGMGVGAPAVAQHSTTGIGSGLTMPFFLVDDKIHSHRKVRSIPRAQRMAAMGLWSVAGAWCRDTLSDGVIPEFMIDELGGTLRQAEALVRAGLWQSHPGGFSVVHWSDWQDTRATVERKREAWRNRQGKSRSHRREADSPAETENVTQVSRVTGAGVTRDSRVSHGGVTESSSHSPITTPPSPPKGGDARERATRIPEPFEVSQAMRIWANTEVPGLDIDRSTAKFVDFWRAKSGKDATKLDWPATWRNWLRRDFEQRPPSGVSRASPERPSTTDQRVQAGLDLAARLAEREQRLELGA